MDSSISSSSAANYPPSFDGELQQFDLGNAYVEILTMCQPFYDNRPSTESRLSTGYYIHPRLEDGLALNNQFNNGNDQANPQDGSCDQQNNNLASCYAGLGAAIHQHYGVSPPSRTSSSLSMEDNDNGGTQDSEDQKHYKDKNLIGSSQFQFNCGRLGDE